MAESILSQVSSRPTLREYAFGLSQSGVLPLAGFIAPTCTVSKSVGFFLRYTDKARFRRQDTRYSLDRPVTQVGREGLHVPYNCTPHALDFPISNLEKMEAEDIENELMEGARILQEAAALDHEYSVINSALAALPQSGAQYNATQWSGSTGFSNPIADLDAAIKKVILGAGGGGSNMKIRIAFGFTAWLNCKNNPNISDKFVVAAGAPPGIAVPTVDMFGKFLMRNPQCMEAAMVQDVAPEGKLQSFGFLLDNDVIVFACQDEPTRLDPSFMKTFRLADKFMVPGSYVRPDGRGEVAKFDWSEDIQNTNTLAAFRLTIS